MPYGSKRGSGEVEGKSERDKEEFADVPKLQFVRYATLEMCPPWKSQMRPKKCASKEEKFNVQLEPSQARIKEETFSV